MKISIGIKKNVTAALFAALLFVSAVFAGTAFAMDRPVVPETSAPENVSHVTVTYNPPGLAVRRTAQIPYSDECFTHDAALYDHTLAQASIGMAVSAFRARGIVLGHQQDNILSFFEQAGFTDVRCEGYDETPGDDTISTAIAKKEIGGTTVIALVPCGGGYGREWASNLTIGTGVRHEGFASAASQAEERLLRYIEDNGLTGHLRLWTSGFSRAAATANLVAGDMTDSGIFEQVYGYCFATPRNTKDPKPYPNIFNVIGKNDPVPMVAFAVWGYGRNGSDLYTPSQESDTDYPYWRAQAEPVCKTLTGSSMRNLPEVNNELRMLLEHLLNVAGTQEKYVNELQDSFRSVFADRTAGNILLTLSDMIERAEEKGSTEELEVLGDYIEALIFAYLPGNEYEVVTPGWDADVPLADNFMHEHSHEVYLTWMLTAKDSALFRTDEGSVRLVVSGDAAVEVTGESGFAGRFMPDGSIEMAPESGWGDAESMPVSPAQLFFARKGTQSVLCIPRDEDYAVAIEPLSDEPVTYFAMLRESGGVTRPGTVEVHTIAGGGDDVYFTVFHKAGGEETPESANRGFTEWTSELPYSPNFVLELENANVPRLSIGALFTVLMGAGIVLAVFILYATVRLIVRHVQHKKRSMAETVVYHALLVAGCLWLEESARFYFGAVTGLIEGLKGFATFWVITLAAGSLWRQRTRRNLLIVPALILALLGDVTLNRSFTTGLWFDLGAVALLILAYAERRHRGLASALCAAAVAITGAVLIGVFRSEDGVMPMQMGCFVVLLAALAYAGVGAGKIPAAGVGVYIASVIMLFRNLIYGKTIVAHAISIGLYYTAIMLFAASCWVVQKKAPEAGDGTAVPEETAKTE